MKTKSAFLLAAVMMFSFTGCNSKTEAPVVNYYSSTEDVTIDKIIKNSVPTYMVEYKGGFKQTISYSGFDDEEYAGLNSSEFYYIYKKSEGKLEMNQVATYSDGYETVLYLSDDKNDPYVYRKSSMNTRKDELSSEELDSLIGKSVLGYETIDAEIGSIAEENGSYVAQIKISEDGKEIGYDTLTIDPVSGLVTKVISSDDISGQDVSIVSEFVFTYDLEIDQTPKTEYVEPEDVDGINVVDDSE